MTDGDIEAASRGKLPQLHNAEEPKGLLEYLYSPFVVARTYSLCRNAFRTCQSDGIAKMPRCYVYRVPQTLKFTDHRLEEQYMRRVLDIDPDLKAPPMLFRLCLRLTTREGR